LKIGERGGQRVTTPEQETWNRKTPGITNGVHDEVLSSLSQSAVIKLLRSQNAPLVLSFLYGQLKLKQQISIAHTPLLEQKPIVTLGEVAAVYPLTQGLAELVAYFGIAARDEACRINGDEWEEIRLGGSPYH
jgi:hypothetical protein